MRLWVVLVFTCKPSGFQRTFLSRAGVELRVFWGLFFSVRMTPHGSSLRAFTRFFSCQPTWEAHIPGYRNDCCKLLHTMNQAQLHLLWKTTMHSSRYMADCCCKPPHTCFWYWLSKTVYVSRTYYTFFFLQTESNSSIKEIIRKATGAALIYSLDKPASYEELLF